jgi:hypothetical protein
MKREQADERVRIPAALADGVELHHQLRGISVQAVEDSRPRFEP